MFNQAPVKGGESFLSRASNDKTALIFPPAEVPPTMNPLLGSAPSFEAFAAHCIPH